MSDKLKFGFYWAAACGGCDVAVLDIDEKILDVAARADIYFWPIAVDGKVDDIRKMEDKFLDVTFFNGAIRNSEQLEVAELLRKKSKVMVAFGACACFGGIPALANLCNRKEILDRVYGNGIISNDNPQEIRPQPKFQAKEGELNIPTFFHSVYKLDDFVPVEYYLPGCPPPVDLILAAVTAIFEGKLPPVGSVIAGDKTVCDTCERVKEKKVVKEFKRPFEIIPDPKKCLLEQGIVCLGSATRSGCGARCPSANMPCRGCMGPTEGTVDHGGKIAGAIATLVEGKDPEEVRKILSQVADPAGTFYRFTLSDSLLKGKILGEVS